MKKTILFFLAWYALLMLVCQNRVTREPLIILKQTDDLPSIIEQIDQDSLVTRIKALEQFGSRYTAEQQARVAEYIFTVLTRQGLDPQFHHYVYKKNAYRNVEAVIRGHRNPDQYLVIGAHYDAKSDRAATSAPGADDNASGVAALLELTRIISRYEMDNTVRVVFFSNEERGHPGSSHYVTYLQSLAEQYLGGIVVDCIGYRHADSLLTIATIPRYEWLAVAAHEIMQMVSMTNVERRVDKQCM